MPSPPCVHLHVHSEYSVLDGACKIDELAKRAAEFGQPALGLTDHGVMSGAVDLYKACKEQGIKPLLGLEAYYVDDHRSDDLRRERNHLTLLARDDAGFRNLVKLTSAGYLEGHSRGKPNVDMELLERHSGGVIALTGCLQSRFCRRLVDDVPAEARAHADVLAQVFGSEDLYFEVQRNGIPEQDKANEGIARIARELGRPLVATADVHYLRREDFDNHRALLCVQTNSTIEAPKMSFDTNEFFLKDSAEMAEAFADMPEAIATTAEIAERCEVELELGKMLIPRYETPRGEPEAAYLRELAEQGLRLRYGDPPPAEALERLALELGVIERMGFDAYFLIVWDFVKFAKENGIAVGPGRGSAAGSIVSYCLAITDVDPLAHNLLFERFLNPERVSMPDIDIDFSVKGRERVIRYVTEKYGEESVAQIVTFGRMLPRAATRDAARVLGYDYNTGDRVAKLIPEPLQGRTKTFDEYLSEEPELRRLYDQDPQAKKIVDTAKGLEGTVRNSSIHAAAVVIADRPLTDIVPLQLAEDKGAAVDGERTYRAITQYSMEPIGEIGLLKMDFLGLRNLDVIETALDLIERTAGERPDMVTLPMDDAGTYEMLARGEGAGVFQFESEGMREALRKVRPTEFEDLVALVALYRPGAMDQIPNYARGKRDPQTVSFPDDRLRPITEQTKGVILYQEQSMQIAKEIAGFSGAEADDLRKAIGKKNREAMAALKPKFFEGCKASETSAAVTETLWTINERSADYSFNRAHAACYALIAYRTAWLKANHPAEYMAGLISSVMQTKDKVPYYVSRCEEMGIDVLPPDVNESGHDFVVVHGADTGSRAGEAGATGDIRFGLDAVKHVGAGAVDVIIAAREDDGSFRSIWDFCRRVSSRTVNKKAIESLVKCGALDSTGASRSGMLKVLEQAQAGGAKAQEDEQLGQGSIFDLGGAGPADAEAAPVPGRQDPPIPLLDDGREEIGTMEKETLGLFLSSHPVKAVRPALRAATDCSLAQLAERRDGEGVTVAGVVTQLKRLKTKKGDPMAFATLDDLEGQVEMIVLGKTYLEAEEVLGGDGVLLVKARLDHKEADQTKLVAQRIEAFEPTPEEVARAAAEATALPDTKRLTVLVSAEISDTFLDDLGDVVRSFPGDHELMLRVGERNLVLGPDFQVASSSACRAELDALPGVTELVA